MEYHGMQEEQKSLNEYMASSKETLKQVKKQRRKKIIIIFICIILLIFFLFYGPFSYVFVSKKQLRFYEVKINNQELSVSEKIKNTTIIPVILEIPNGNSRYFSINQEYKEIFGDSYLLSIESYRCFLLNENKEASISCSDTSKNKKETNDTKYTKMQILEYKYEDSYTYSLSAHHLSRSYYVGENSITTRPYEEYSIIYEGEYIEDLTAYISEENVYVIHVDFTYKNTHGTISFGVVNDGKTLFAL